MDSDPPVSLLNLASHSCRPAAKFESTVVLVDDISTCSITVNDIQLVVDDSGATAWDLHYDGEESGACSLRIKFNDKRRAGSFLAKFNRLLKVEEPRWHMLASDLGEGSTSKARQWSSTVPSSTTDGATTPESTTAQSDGITSGAASTVGFNAFPDNVPCPGKTYKIQHRKTGQLITLEEGKVRLRRPEDTKAVGGWHWVCAEKNGWLGFRSPVSATYMGHNKNGGIWAKQPHHKSHESFCVRRHPDEGYVILVQYSGELQQIRAVKSGSLVVSESADETNLDTQWSLWLFEEV